MVIKIDDPGLHKNIKIVAANNGETMTELVERIIDDNIDKYKVDQGKETPEKSKKKSTS